MANQINAVVGGTLPDRAIVDLRKELDSGSPAKQFGNVEDNILKYYTNVIPVFTLAPLTPTNLDSLQSNGTFGTALQNVVLSSAGRYDAERVATFYGSPEYFINNVEIYTFATPTKISGLSGNLTINFDVHEPYSLGLFMQSLQTAAIKSGYTNYIECAWLLRIEFLGYTPNTFKQQIIPGTTRDYPIKLQQIQFTSNEGGSKYTVRCLDFNLEAFNNVYGSVEGSITVEGGTVGEALADLTKKLNEAQLKLKDSKLIVNEDTYKIIVSGAEPDKILKSKFVNADGQPAERGSNSTTVKNESADRDQKQGGKRSFPFPALEGRPRKIEDIIKEIMKTSEYCVNALKNIPKDGYVVWYRPSAKLKYKGQKFQLDTVQNRPAYDIEYYIRPYRAHHSNWKLPSDETKGFAPDDIPAQIKKKYDYLYTGQNDDIIRWELKFDNTFYTAMSAQGYNSQRGAIDSDGKTIKPEDVGGNTPGTNIKGLTLETHAGKMLRDKRSSYAAPQGGGTKDTAEIRVARAFEQAMLLDTEMIMLDLTILGDPYYLTKSGVFIDNVAPVAPGAQVNSDGTMASEEVEIRLYLRFKSPVDAPPKGRSLFLFPAAGFTDSPYSGLFRIRTVKSKFIDGVFTQELNLFRDRGQQPEELINQKSDPFLQSPGLSPTPDPNRAQLNGTPAAAAVEPAIASTPEVSAAPAAAAPAAVSSDKFDVQSNSPVVKESATVEVQTFPVTTSTVEVTREWRATDNQPPPFQKEGNVKTGPQGQKLEYSEDLERQLNNGN
jgi:hypothetical protein